jgi:hypothetical protein
MKKLTPAAVIAGAMLALGAASADAGPCTDEITKFEDAVSRRAATNPGAGPTARQSVGAQLSRQPTPSSVAQAEAHAQSTFMATLARAKALDAEGNAECMQALDEAKLRFNVP